MNETNKETALSASPGLALQRGNRALALLDVMEEVAASERHYQRWARGMMHTTDGKSHITEEMDVLHVVDRMEAVARRIAQRDECATSTSRINDHKGRDRGSLYRLTALGKEVWQLCRSAVPLLEQLYPDCRLRKGEPSWMLAPVEAQQDAGMPEAVRTVFNPFITVLLRACQRANLTLTWYTLQGPDGVMLDVNHSKARKTIERLVRFVRRTCRSRQFRYLQNNYARNERENFKACCKYLAAIFARHSKPLILRVDLYFLPEHGVWARTTDATGCIERFRRALRESRIVPDVLAWVCKLENGCRRGIHLHALVAVDGHKHREAASLSKMIGEKWAAWYSKGTGSYFNCYVRKDEYKFNGLGLVHLSDTKKLLGIREAIRYITKGSFQVGTGHTRNLWKGNMPKSAVKRGAPRKPEHDMALVDEILSKV